MYSFFPKMRKVCIKTKTKPPILKNAKKILKKKPTLGESEKEQCHVGNDP